MIRIELRHPPASRRRKSALAVSAMGVLLIGLGTAGIYWTDQHYPLYGVWRGLWPSDRQHLAGQARRVEELTWHLPTLTEKPAGDEITEAHLAATPPSGELLEVPLEALDPPPPALPPEEGDAERIAKGQGTDTCWRVLQLNTRLPPDLRLTSLTCKASGEYSLEGKGSSQSEIEGFLETLRRLPSEVDLSWWREGEVLPKQTNPLKFIFRGRLSEVHPANPEVITAARAVELTEEIAVWARQSGLDRLSLSQPIEAPQPVTEPLHRRQKLWAIGSYAQIDAFLHRLKPLENQVVLGELVIVEVYQEDAELELARMYAGVDFLVNQPR